MAGAVVLLLTVCLVLAEVIAPTMLPFNWVQMPRGIASQAAGDRSTETDPPQALVFVAQSFLPAPATP